MLLKILPRLKRTKTACLYAGRAIGLLKY